MGTRLEAVQEHLEELQKSSHEGFSFISVGWLVGLLSGFASFIIVFCFGLVFLFGLVCFYQCPEPLSSQGRRQLSSSYSS